MLILTAIRNTVFWYWASSCVKSVWTTQNIFLEITRLGKSSYKGTEKSLFLNEVWSHAHSLELDSMQIWFGAAVFFLCEMQIVYYRPRTLRGIKAVLYAQNPFSLLLGLFVSCLGCRTAEGPILRYSTAFSCFCRLTWDVYSF